MRILGTLANAANGYARNGVAPIYVGPGATNASYAQAEDKRLSDLQAAQEQFENDKEIEEQRQKQHETEIMGANGQGQIDKGQAMTERYENAINPGIYNRPAIAQPASPARPAVAPTGRPQKTQQPPKQPSAGQPRIQPGQAVNFHGKRAIVQEVRRNSQTGEYAYNIGGYCYRDSELK